MILFAASELVSQLHGRTSLYLNRGRLRKAVIAVSIFFIITLLLRIISLVMYT
jgi:hypothetical protein